MPRDGSGVYHRPVGTDAVTDTTIESTKYNNNVLDVENDLNYPRPIVAGGTGASSAQAAMVNLGGEIAGQIITNFDSNPIVSGSFSAASTATSAPSTNATSGIAYLTDANDLVVEARDMVTGIKYVRIKAGGTWGSWAADQSSQFVKKAGDTMTGNLLVDTTATASTSAVSLNTVPGQAAAIYGEKSGKPRWVIVAGNGTAESGSNAGSDFSILRCSDAGAQIDSPFSIIRATGVATFTQALYANAGMYVAGDLHVTRGDNTGYTFYGSTNSNYFGWDGAELYASTTVKIGGQLAVVGTVSVPDLFVSRSATTGCIYFGTSGAHYILFDGATFSLGGGNLSVPGYAASAGAMYTNSGRLMSISGSVIPSVTCWNQALGSCYGMWNSTTGLVFGNADGSGNPGSQLAWVDGSGNFSAANNCIATNLLYGAAGCHFINDQWGWICNTSSGDTTLLRGAGTWTNWRSSDGALIHYTGNIYKPGGGVCGDSSDARIKNVLGNYDSGLDAILALQPVRYTFKGNDTPDPPVAPPHSLTVEETLKLKIDEHPPASDDPLPIEAPYYNSPHRSSAMRGTEFIGLIAQACEGVMPELVEQRRGYIDGVEVTDLRDIDTGPLVFALVNAVKTLAARVEALEAAR